MLYFINKLFVEKPSKEEEGKKESEGAREEEKEEAVPTESLIKSGDVEDVTDLFQSLSKELERNEMIRSEHFILDDTMQSYELFNKKTDFRMDLPLDFNLDKLFQEGVLKPAEELNHDEVGEGGDVDCSDVG